MSKLRQDADQIIRAALHAAQPDTAVQAALKGITFPENGRVLLVALGKAAWQMAKASHEALGERIDRGIVITKYAHAKGPVGDFAIREAAHPVPDDNSFSASREALALVDGLTPDDTVLLLISGGGSALFEKPLIPGAELQDITGQLLAGGADIVEMNTLRKRLSAVKGGRFAQACAPAKVHAIILSDVLGDPLDMVASGPAYPDSSTCQQALDIVRKYKLRLSPQALGLLEQETPKELQNVTSHITGSVRVLCEAAAKEARALGYEPILLTDSLNCQAREAGSFLAAIARSHQNTDKSLCYLAGGETVVRLVGKGKGGRNQEIALGAAEGIAGLKDTAVFSLGSDGTDGPTDAAGGYVDQDSAKRLKALGHSPYDVLEQNDAYHALQKLDGLLMTGATGTNVNDISVLLIKR